MNQNITKRNVITRPNKLNNRISRLKPEALNYMASIGYIYSSCSSDESSSISHLNSSGSTSSSKKLCQIFFLKKIFFLTRTKIQVNDLTPAKKFCSPQKLFQHSQNRHCPSEDTASTRSSNITAVQILDIQGLNSESE